VSIKEVRMVCCDACGKPVLGVGYILQFGIVKFMEYSESGASPKVWIHEPAMSQVYCSTECLKVYPKPAR
jgi:hypothetical protein